MPFVDIILFAFEGVTDIMCFLNHYLSKKNYPKLREEGIGRSYQSHRQEELELNKNFITSLNLSRLLGLGTVFE